MHARRERERLSAAITNDSKTSSESFFETYASPRFLQRILPIKFSIPLPHTLYDTHDDDHSDSSPNQSKFPKFLPNTLCIWFFRLGSTFEMRG